MSSALVTEAAERFLYERGWSYGQAIGWSRGPVKKLSLEQACGKELGRPAPDEAESR